jgi:hypothetical protein
MIIGISDKKISINNTPDPLGVRGRNSDNQLIYKKIKWKPSLKSTEGIMSIYNWIKKQIKKIELIDFKIFIKFKPFIYLI